MKIILAWLIAILIYMGLFCFSAFMIWGVGLLFINAFSIDFTFTYPMALVINFMIMIIGSYCKN